jgi:hypothetical protein
MTDPKDARIVELEAEVARLKGSLDYENKISSQLFGERDRAEDELRVARALVVLTEAWKTAEWWIQQQAARASQHSPPPQPKQSPEPVGDEPAIVRRLRCLFDLDVGGKKRDVLGGVEVHRDEFDELLVRLKDAQGTSEREACAKCKAWGDTIIAASVGWSRKSDRLEAQRDNAREELSALKAKPVPDVETEAFVRGFESAIATASRKLGGKLAIQPAGGEEEGMWKAMRILESLQPAPAKPEPPGHTDGTHGSIPKIGPREATENPVLPPTTVLHRVSCLKTGGCDCPRSVPAKADEKCPECYGSGDVRGADDHWVECPNCNGSGKKTTAGPTATHGQAQSETLPGPGNAVQPAPNPTDGGSPSVAARAGHPTPRLTSELRLGDGSCKRCSGTKQLLELGTGRSFACPDCAEPKPPEVNPTPRPSDEEQEQLRELAAQALGDAIERPHGGRLAEAVDALERYLKTEREERRGGR